MSENKKLKIKKPTNSSGAKNLLIKSNKEENLPELNETPEPSSQKSLKIKGSG